MKTNEYPLGWCIERGLPKPVVPEKEESAMKHINMNGNLVTYEPIGTSPCLSVLYPSATHSGWELLTFPSMARLERWVMNRVATKVDGLWSRPAIPTNAALGRGFDLTGMPCELLTKAEMRVRVKELFHG